MKTHKKRKKIKAFEDQDNTFLVDCRNDKIFAFGRYLDGQKVICVFNLSDTEEWFSLDVLKYHKLKPHKGLVDLVDDFSIDQPYDQIKLQPLQFHWISDLDWI